MTEKVSQKFIGVTGIKNVLVMTNCFEPLSRLQFAER